MTINENDQRAYRARDAIDSRVSEGPPKGLIDYRHISRAIVSARRLWR